MSAELQAINAWLKKIKTWLVLLLLLCFERGNGLTKEKIERCLKKMNFLAYHNNLYKFLSELFAQMVPLCDKELFSEI